MKVVWTRTAEASFIGVVDYPLELWTVEIATNFVEMVEHTLEQIIEHPEMFKISEYDNQSRAALITKHITMFYRILENKIEIEYFLGNFDDPTKIQDLLKSV